MYILLFITLDGHENMASTTGMNNAYDTLIQYRTRDREGRCSRRCCVRIIIIIIL